MAENDRFTNIGSFATADDDSTSMESSIDSLKNRDNDRFTNIGSFAPTPSSDVEDQPVYRPDGSKTYDDYTNKGKTFYYPMNSASHSSRIVFFINHYTSGKLGAFTQRNYSSLGNNLAQNLNQRGKEFAGYAGSLAQVQGGTNFEKEWSEKAMSYIPQKKRLNKTISLYMPHALQTTYGMTYSEIDMGGLTGQFISDLSSGRGLNTSLENLGVNGIKTALSKLASNALGAVSTKFNAANAEAVLNKSLGRIENPRREVTFEGQEIRRHQFQFMFAPRTPNESKMVMDIIKTFKLHMHPELVEAGNGMYITYPDDFDIQYEYRANKTDGSAGEFKENPFINKVLTCVLENLSVDYAPTGHWSTFADGSPTHIAMQLHFREIEPIHRKMIVEGF